MNKKVLFVYRTARRKIYKDWQKDKSPDSLLFGANHLKKMGYQVDIFDWAYAPLNPLHLIFYPLEHAIISQVGMGFKIDQAVTLLPKIKNYDVIVGTGDSAGLPLLALKYFGLIKKPIIFMTSGLAGALKNKTNSWVANFYRKILPAADIFTSYTQVEIDFFEKEMGIKKNKIKYISLGTDYDYFSRKSKFKREVICAIGTELGRDYKTLFESVKNLPVRVEVACHPDNIKDLNIPSNVKIHLNIPVQKVLEIYQRSLLSVVPCFERHRSSGQMVLLESAAAGLPTIASKIKGITSAFEFKDNQHLVFTKPEDPQQLRTKILYLLNNQKVAKRIGQTAANYVKTNYTTISLAKNLSDFIDAI